MPVLPSVHQSLHHTLPAEAFRHSLSKTLSCQGPRAQTGCTLGISAHRTQEWHSAPVVNKSWQESSKSWCSFSESVIKFAVGTKCVFFLTFISISKYKQRFWLRRRVQARGSECSLWGLLQKSQSAVSCCFYCFCLPLLPVPLLLLLLFFCFVVVFVIVIISLSSVIDSIFLMWLPRCPLQ